MVDVEGSEGGCSDGGSLARVEAVRAAARVEMVVAAYEGGSGGGGGDWRGRKR